MPTSSITSFSDLFATLWQGWKYMFHSTPYWDPYGATLTLALLIAAIGYTIKQVMD